jgi:DNA sulfur modification protein DndC
MAGNIQLMKNGRPVPGPYTQKARIAWLTKLLEAQCHIRETGPQEAHNLDLIRVSELEEIRRIWVMDKHEIEDCLPGIYEKVTGNKYPGAPLDDNLIFAKEEMQLLSEICGDDHMHYELTRELISLTRQQKSSARRAKLFGQLEKTFKRHFFDNQEEAIQRAYQLELKKSQYDEKSRANLREEDVNKIPMEPVV